MQVTNLILSFYILLNNFVRVGDPFTTGNCGGEMKISQCIECKESVGDISHQLNQTNRRLF